MKYVFDSSGVNSEGSIIIEIIDEHNEKVSVYIDQNIKWERTVGPVSKGFNAEINIVNTTGRGKLQMHTEIDVSKNDSPFTRKAKDGFYTSKNRSAVTMHSTYKIDY